ncbi:hypothetical protein OROGR_025606 [Orobanche gracilis]
MEEPKNCVYQEDEEKNPLLVYLLNLFGSIKLPFPQKNKNGKLESASGSSQAEEPIMVKPDNVENEIIKPSVVTFPRQSFVPLKLEGEAEGDERSTNPVILWQVYAIGGFYILKWAWTRWNEQKGQKKSDEDVEEPPPAPSSG